MRTVDLEQLGDLCTPWCLRVAATLRIGAHIEAGAGSLEELAAAARCDADALGRVLRHLVGKGVFEEPSPGRFALNAVARALEEQRIGLDLDGFGGRMAHAWGTLLAAVRTGEPAYRDAFGRPFWDDLGANPAIGDSFDALMGLAGHGVPDPEILVDGNWAAVRSVVDVGGGTGALLAEILRAHPAVRGTVVDLPRTVARAAETFAAAGVADRATAIGQSFFDPLPAGADVYVIKNVLADWADREATAILRRCAEAARPAGRVVLSGGVAPDGQPSRSADLLMFVLVGGKERTFAQVGDLAAAAGLEVHTTGRSPSGRFLVECRPRR